MSLSKAQQKEVRSWMTVFAEKYAGPTPLAEACGEELGLYEDESEYAIDEDVYDLALEFYDEDDRPRTR